MKALSPKQRTALLKLADVLDQMRDTGISMTAVSPGLFQIEYYEEEGDPGLGVQGVSIREIVVQASQKVH